MIEKQQAIKFIVNKILECIFYDSIYQKKHIKIYDYNNEIAFDIRPFTSDKNHLIIEAQLNGLCISTTYENGNYCDFILKLGNIIENIWIEYVNELEDHGIYKELKSIEDLQEIRQE